MIYLDNSATTRCLDSAAQAALDGLTNDFFNISSPYSAALNTEKKLGQAIKALASSLNAKENELIFTSGGTESDNTALFCAPENSEVIVSNIEHHAILNCERALKKRGCKMLLCPASPDGTVNVDALLSLITEKTGLVSIMHVNNETGAINNIKALCQAVKEKNKNILFHSDGVQAYMHVPTDLNDLGVDMYSVSGHKVHAPKGIGILYVRSGMNFEPYIFGGGQQNNRRSGTVNVPGILGLSKAVEELGDDFAQKISKTKQAYIEALSRIDGVKFICPDSAPNVLSVAFTGVRASTLQNAVENELIIGKGSACTSRASKISHVLDAMGIPVALAECTVRLSFGAFNSPDEAEYVSSVLNEKITYLRRFKRK